MISSRDTRQFDASLGCLFRSALDGLATRLAHIDGLHSCERDAFVEATRESLYATLHAKLGRLLLLELNAARVEGRLAGENSQARWNHFIELSSETDFWRQLEPNYPSLLACVNTIIDNRCSASVLIATHWARDREELAELCGRPPGKLREISFGAGDAHQRGRTVAIIHSDGGKLVYKPRSLQVDAALARFVSELSACIDGPLTIHVPRVLTFEEHGWSEFIEHRYAADDGQLAAFYRGLGHWLAIMRLLGGCDLHAENLIAHGASPVIVDCETLFMPQVPHKKSELGSAADRAAELLSGSVFNIGLLPTRGFGFGLRGVDISGAGMLPGQQPTVPLPTIVNPGSDNARIDIAPIATKLSGNHPSPEPALDRYWPEVLGGFDQLNEELRTLDRADKLYELMTCFADCDVRVVARATEVYAQIAGMLWHPVALHNKQDARKRAFELLSGMAANVALAPDDPEVIEAEIEDLLEGDIPYFVTRVSGGRLRGPRDTLWLPHGDLVEAALEHWRDMDADLESNVIRCALVSAYINDGWMPDESQRLLPSRPRTGDVETRRRRQAARVMESLVSTAIVGDDGTVAWIAPSYEQTGWTVQPLHTDFYSGISGLAFVTVAYLRETSLGYADPVEGLDALLPAMLRSIELGEAKRLRLNRMDVAVRPPAPGAYTGLGAQIWVQIVLNCWGMDTGYGLALARSIATGMPKAAEADEVHDVLSGKAGAIVPLLALAGATGEARYLDMACRIADLLCDQAVDGEKGSRWISDDWPEGAGGFAHGATGIGWALHKLVRATGSERYAEMARSAFAFEESLFDADEQGWLDLRMLEGMKTAAAWCHGAVGIGLAHLDMDPALENPEARLIVRRAARLTWERGVGWSHCLCHGDASAWELLDRAIAAGVGPSGLDGGDLDRSGLVELFLTSLEEHGPVSGLARDAFVPGLMAGLSGVAYQLLRLRPQCTLPSVLTLSVDAACEEVETEHARVLAECSSG